MSGKTKRCANRAAQALRMAAAALRSNREQDDFEERYHQRVLHNFAQRAKAMGIQLVPSDNHA